MAVDKVRRPFVPLAHTASLNAYGVCDYGKGLGGGDKEPPVRG